MVHVSERTFALFRDLGRNGFPITDHSVQQACLRRPESADALRYLFAEYRRLQSMFDFSTETILTEMKAHLWTHRAPERDGPNPAEPSIFLQDRLRTGALVPTTRYTLEEVLGIGGGGAVHLARDDVLGRRLALKVFLSDARHPPTPQRVSRFLDEAQITGQLDHPGVVPVHDVGLDDHGRLFYAMRLVRGWDLQQVIGWMHGEGTPPEGMDVSLVRVVGLLVRVCETLAYVHSKGVLHRDIKPSNLMVGRFGQVHVMDWGVAKLIGADEASRNDARPAEQRSITVRTNRASGGGGESGGDALTTMDGDVMGTPAFMSPEQAHGRLEEIDERSDVYSLGAVLYAVLCGHSPYAARGTRPSPKEILRRVRDCPPQPVSVAAPGSPSELRAICEKAMARAPADRYREIRAMAADLRAWLDGRAVGALRVGALRGLWNWTRRNPASAAVALLGALLLALAGEFELDRRAQAAEGRAERALGDADHMLRSLRSRADDLVPASSAVLPAMRAWLGDARRLAAERDRHLGLEAPESRAVVADIDRFRGQGGPLAEIEARAELTERTIEATLESSSAKAAWARAIREVADDPAYGGLRLSPIEGLLPRGRDPFSGLQEFAHFQSGELPEEREGDGLRMDASTGLIFVLVPAGRFVMGAQASSALAANFDSESDAAEGPVREVRVPAFLLSKFELTQGQWKRLGGGEPAVFRAGIPFRVFGFDEHEFDDRHPVESVSLRDAEALLSRWGLALPREDQWEWACRSGLPLRSLDETYLGAPGEFINIADLSHAALEPVDGAQYDDGYAIHAPVGSFAANEWGLHDMIGNVLEWCWPAVDAARKSEGPTRLFAVRGGSFASTPWAARPTSRRLVVPDSRTHDTGVRPALELPEGRE